MANTIGSNQVPGGNCANPFHLTAVDAGFDPEVIPARDSTCPSCKAVMMPGSAVTPEFYVEYTRRLAAGICLASRGGRFIHARKASTKALAKGACLCAQHNR